MKKYKVCLDIDGTVLNYQGALQKLLAEKGITFYPEKLTDYNYSGDIGCDKSLIHKYKCDPRLHELMEPFSGALLAVKYLLRHENVDVHMYTGVSREELKPIRHEFCKSIGITNGEIYTTKKPPIMDADALFDDCLGVHEDWLAAGSKAKLYLINAPYNQVTTENKDKEIWKYVVRCKDLLTAVQLFCIDMYIEEMMFNE